MNHHTRINRAALAAAILGALCSGLAQADTAADPQQDTGKPATNAPAELTQKMDDIVVTGSANAGGVKKLDASYSITSVSADDMRDAAPSSTADLLKVVPGMWVESSGGVSGANMNVRGFPAAGDAPYVTVELDGSPLYPQATLSFLETSSLFRIDDTVERVEVLRGGPSPIFSNGQPGATVNFIQKDGTDTPEGAGSLRVTFGSESLRRIDGYYGGEIAPNWFASIGGFWREGDGVHDSGFPTDDGGQLSATLTHTFDNGSFGFYARHTNDKNAFLTAVPLLADGNGHIRTFPGFDARNDTLIGNAMRHADIQVTPGATPGTISRDLADGRGIDLSVYGSKLDLEFGDWSLSNRANYVIGDTPTNALFTGNNPKTLGSFIDDAIASANGNAAVVAAAGGQLATGGTASFANGGNLTDMNQQVIDAGFWIVDKRIRSFTDELRLSRELFSGNTLTFGAYVASYGARDRWFLGNSRLMTVRNNADPINLTLDNGAIIAGNGGFYGASFFSLDAGWSGRNVAGYLSDEWVIDDWRFDAGARFEKQRVRGTIQNVGSVDLDGNPLTVFNNNASVPDGTFRHVNQDDDHSSFTAGANYSFSEHVSMFGRINAGFVFPSFDNLRDGQTNTQKVDQYEVGFKAADKAYSLYLTAFYNDFKGLPYQAFDANGNNINLIGGSDAHGVEFEAALRPFQNFELALTGNWMDAKYKNYASAAQDFTGNRVMRQPKFQFRLTPSYFIPTDWGFARVFATYTHVGDRYSDIGNGQPLPSYHTLDVGAEADIGEHFNLRLTGSNVTNELALTEGNARAGLDDVNGTGVFLGRAIYGRNYQLSLMYRF